jgi:hypothetical protein
MSSSTTILYNTYTLSELNWVREHTPGIYKIPVSAFSGSNYVHPAINNIELIRYNYTKNSVLSNMALNAFFILNDYMYINFGTIDPTNSSLILQMGKSADQTITLTNIINKLEIYSSTDNDILVKDSSGNTISRSNNSRKPYYNVWIIDTSLLPSSTITIQNCGVSTATVSYDDGTGSSSVTDVTMNGSTVVVDGVAELSDDNLGLKQFITSITSLIPENELTESELHKTYLLTEFDSAQPQFVVGDLYTVVEVYDSVDPSIVVGYKYKTVGKTSIPVGSVSNIRYSLQSNSLILCWSDPKDLVINNVVVSSWSKTVVRYNKFLSSVPEEQRSYPATPEDGYHLITITERNAHNVIPFTKDDVEENTIYYIRFFPCNTAGVYTIDTVDPNENRCATILYNWAMLNQALEDGVQHGYGELLPPVGSQLNVKYIVNDNTCNTRESVLEDLVKTENNKITPVDTMWNIIGYNKTVPRYIKYRKAISNNEYSYVFVSSLDDSTTLKTFEYLNGQTKTKKIVTGNLCERPISIGCRVYTRSYDENETEWVYSDEDNLLVDGISETNFVYGSEDSQQDQSMYAYSVPTYIIVNNEQYDFCGYTMTVQPDGLLAAVNKNTNSLVTTMQWNASTKANSIVGQNTFSPNMQYYYFNNGSYIEIDISNLSNNVINTFEVNGVEYDVFIIDEFGKLKLATEKYIPGILQKELDGTNPTSTIGGNSYSKKLTNETSLVSLTACYKWKNNTYYPQNTKIYYEPTNSIYNVTTAHTSSTTPDADSNVSAIINLNEQVDTTPEGNNYCIYGEKIPVRQDMQIYENSKGNDRNMYEGSWFRYWINSKYGVDDNTWNAFKPFDNPSTSNMSLSNGLRLKLAGDKDFLKQIIPSVNPTNIYSNWVSFTSNYEYNNNMSSDIDQKFVCFPTDYFFPLSMYEVFLHGVNDGTARFKEVFTTSQNNTSRKKWYMTANGTVSKPVDQETTNGYNWWLRSPTYNSSIHEYIVYTTGSSSNHATYDTYGVCPACTIG